MPINYNFESLIPNTTYEVKEEFISKKSTIGQHKLRVDMVWLIQNIRRI
jgi:hypothetical protein